MQFSFKKLPDQKNYSPKLRAIIYTAQPQVNGKQFLKYNHVDNSSTGLTTFMRFARRFPGAAHVNFYCRDTGMFIEQVKF